MKFDMTQLQPESTANNLVEVGNVYPAKGGAKPKFWLIVSVTGHYAHALGLDREGQIVSSTSYGVHAFEGRRLLGRCEEIKDFQPTITWTIEP